MGKLTSTSRKNENNTDISVYLIYLRKLHTDTRKIYGFNFFEEIAIGFTIASRRLRNLLKVFLAVFLLKLINAAIMLAFSSSLVWY